VEVVASLSQSRTAAAQCGFFTYKSVPVIFEPPCMLNYELFCKRNWIPLSSHFIYLNSGSLLGLKMAKKIAETCRPVNN